MRQNPLTLYGMIIAQGQALMLIGVSGLNLLVRSENTIADIPIIKIRPNKAQPRKVFSEDELSALSRSIAENGILQPLTVRKVSSTEYELVAGERRLRAAVMAGLRKVPCIVVKCSDRESAVYALLENLQRADLGILSEEEQEWMEKAGLSERHARALIRIENETVRREVLSRIITENLNVKQSERLVGIYLNSTPKPSRVKGNSKAVIKDIRIFLNTINRAIDTMRLSGINAQSNKTDTEDFIEYTIRIPKSTLYSPDKSA